MAGPGAVPAWFEDGAVVAYARGITKESLIFRMAILHHNYIRPHGGIAYRMPAKATGIDIQGTDRWLTLIQNTVAAA